MRAQCLEQQRSTSILFTHYGDDWIRGSERCLLDLLTHLDREKFNPVVWCNTKVMADEVRSLDVSVYRTDFPLLFGWQKPRFDLRAFFRLVRFGKQLIEEQQIQLIHANSGAPNQWLNLVARGLGIPLLAHLHCRYPLRDRISLGLHQVSMAVGVNQTIIDQLLQDGMPEERTGVIPNGIDTERLGQQTFIDLRHLLNLNENDFVIATVGSLIHRKGIDLIIEAIARLVKQGVPAQLVIIGNGSEWNRLQQQVQQLGIARNVIFMGERTDVCGLLSSADLFVSAAREEVFGLVLAEAGLAGLAVVAPAVGGIPDVVIHGKTGTLIPPEDVDALTNAIFVFYHAPRLRHEMGKAGQLHVLKYFTIQRNVKRFEQLYTRMLSEPSMRMRWYSHWQLKDPFVKAIRQLFARSFREICHGR